MLLLLHAVHVGRLHADRLKARIGGIRTQRTGGLVGVVSLSSGGLVGVGSLRSGGLVGVGAPFPLLLPFTPPLPLPLQWT